MQEQMLVWFWRVGTERPRVRRAVHIDSRCPDRERQHRNAEYRRYKHPGGHQRRNGEYSDGSYERTPLSTPPARALQRRIREGCRLIIDRCRAVHGLRCSPSRRDCPHLGIVRRAPVVRAHCLHRSVSSSATESSVADTRPVFGAAAISHGVVLSDDEPIHQIVGRGTRRSTVD